jgi:predicted nucleic acid-binding protein
MPLVPPITSAIFHSAPDSGVATVKAKAAGKGFPTSDGYIAAIAASRGLIVATGDTSPFDAAGISVVNPWEAQL